MARREVTVTGPDIDIGLVLGEFISPEEVFVLAPDVITDTLPSAVFECWMDTDEVMGVKASEDLPDVSGFTDIACCCSADGPDKIDWPVFWNKTLLVYYHAFGCLFRCNHECVC